MPNILRCKVIIGGDQAVGKSTLLSSFITREKPSKAYSMTTKTELVVKTISIPDSDFTVELFIYDSPGSALFTNTIDSDWEGCSMVMLVFDVTLEKSLSGVNRWLEKAISARGLPLIPGVLVGTKTDLDGLRAVKSHTAAELANNLGLTYFETSSYEDDEVEAPFIYLANAFYTDFINKTKEMDKPLL
eukprot:TRINITY_DN13914_c0_g1_i1.p1 TRINITY_DN13914_c0_g1~~TRINITY_DN13914_c0_g1_i1.p1  ORF type:complete len:197 (+),score=30.35 TRINITY_DN13914_c0_g1_i1:29-592(+)